MSTVPTAPPQSPAAAGEQALSLTFAGLGVLSIADLERYLGRRWSSTYDRVTELKPLQLRGSELSCVCGSHISHSAKGALRVDDAFIAKGKCLKRVLEAARAAARPADA